MREAAAPAIMEQEAAGDARTTDLVAATRGMAPAGHVDCFVHDVRIVIFILLYFSVAHENKDLDAELNQGRIDLSDFFLESPGADGLSPDVVLR